MKWFALPQASTVADGGFPGITDRAPSKLMDRVISAIACEIKPAATTGARESDPTVPAWEGAMELRRSIPPIHKLMNVVNAADLQIRVAVSAYRQLMSRYE